MGQVTVSLNGRTYRLKCEDGEEQRLFALVEHVRARIDNFIDEFGQVGDDRLMLMAALAATDDLLASRDEPQHVDDQTQRADANTGHYSS